VITGMFNGVKALWQPVTGWLVKVPGFFRSFFGGAINWLFSAGENIIQGLWDGMKHLWNSVTGWLGGLGGVIKGLKGPLEKDLVLLQPQGAAIIQGLQVGMRSQFGALASTLRQATAGIVGSASAGVTSSAGTLGVGGGVGGAASVIFDFRGSQMMSDAEIQRLTDRIGGLLATTGLPMSGMQVKRS